jgi:hypothetical protein
VRSQQESQKCDEQIAQYQIAESVPSHHRASSQSFWDGVKERPALSDILSTAGRKDLEISKSYDVKKEKARREGRRRIGSGLNAEPRAGTHRRNKPTQI